MGGDIEDNCLKYTTSSLVSSVRGLARPRHRGPRYHGISKPNVISGIEWFIIMKGWNIRANLGLKPLEHVMFDLENINERFQL